MFKLISKPAVLIVWLLSFFPLYCYSQIPINEDSKLLMKSCVTNGLKNLKTKFSNLTEENAKYISIYGCFCAFKESKKTLFPAEAPDFINARNCVHYAVLRDAMRNKNNSTVVEDTKGAAINQECIANFPHDLNDDSVNLDVSNFCNCASILTEKIYEDIKPLKLNEDQIYEKLNTVIQRCRYGI